MMDYVWPPLVNEKPRQLWILKENFEHLLHYRYTVPKFWLFMHERKCDIILQNGWLFLSKTEPVLICSKCDGLHFYATLVYTYKFTFMNWKQDNQQIYILHMHSKICIVVYLRFDLLDIIFTPFALYSVVDYDLSSNNNPKCYCCLSVTSEIHADFFHCLGNGVNLKMNMWTFVIE